MNIDENNIEDLFGSFSSEMQDMSDEEALLIRSLSDNTAETDETNPDDKKKPEEPKPTIPLDEEDFLKNTGVGDTETEDNTDDNADDRDDSHDADTGSVSDDEDDSSSYFKIIAEGLNKLGKFGDKPLPEKWDQDTFLEFYDEFTESRVNAGIEEKISDKWGGEGVKIFNDIFVNGMDPREYFGRYNEVLDLESLDLEKESNQKLVVSRYLEALGQDEEEILDQIEVLEDKGKLAERSEKYKEKLIEDEKRALATEAAEKEAQIAQKKKDDAIRYSAIKEVVNKAIANKEINGIPLNLSDAKELLPFATDPAWRLPNGATITDADKTIMEIKKDPVKWVALCKLLKEGLNVDPIKNKGGDERADAVFKFKTKKPTSTKSKDPLDIFLRKAKF